VNYWQELKQRNILQEDNITIMDIDPKKKDALLQALKKAERNMGRGADVRDDGDSINIINIHPVWGGSEVAKVLHKLRIKENDVDIRTAR
jgi:hypothetical protein